MPYVTETLQHSIVDELQSAAPAPAIGPGGSQLAPEIPGEGRPFDEIVAVDTDARSLDRLLGFLGRGPNG